MLPSRYEHKSVRAWPHWNIFPAFPLNNVSSNIFLMGNSKLPKSSLLLVSHKEYIGRQVCSKKTKNGLRMWPSSKLHMDWLNLENEVHIVGWENACPSCFFFTWNTKYRDPATRHKEGPGHTGSFSRPFFILTNRDLQCIWELNNSKTKVIRSGGKVPVHRISCPNKV